MTSVAILTLRFRNWKNSKLNSAHLLRHDEVGPLWNHKNFVQFSGSKGTLRVPRDMCG